MDFQPLNENGTRQILDIADSESIAISGGIASKIQVYHSGIAYIAFARLNNQAFGLSEKFSRTVTAAGKSFSKLLAIDIANYELLERILFLGVKYKTIIFDQYEQTDNQIPYNWYSRGQDGILVKTERKKNIAYIPLIQFPPLFEGFVDAGDIIALGEKHTSSEGCSLGRTLRTAINGGIEEVAERVALNRWWRIGYPAFKTPVPIGIAKSYPNRRVKCFDLSHLSPIKAHTIAIVSFTKNNRDSPLIGASCSHSFSKAFEGALLEHEQMKVTIDVCKHEGLKHQSESLNIFFEQANEGHFLSTRYRTYPSEHISPEKIGAASLGKIDTPKGAFWGAKALILDTATLSSEKQKDYRNVPPLPF
jgi:hypothetical protein